MEASRLLWIVGGMILVLALISSDDKTMAGSYRQKAEQLRSQEIHSFAFQLQSVNIEAMKTHPADLFVFDWEFCDCNKIDIEALKRKDKFVLSYLSIGEAENYRDYWKESWNSNPPVFLEKENPEWKGNFKVHYWDPSWQQIIMGKLDRIVNAGYDGVYLDIVDAYYYFEQQGRTTAKQEMIDFVKALSRQAKLTNPEFKIIPQNAIDLVQDDSYLAKIDGVGKESTWYIDDTKQSTESLNWELPLLDKVAAAGKWVLTIDYPTKPALQCDFFAKARAHHFVPYVSNRLLDQLFTWDEASHCADMSDGMQKK